MHKNIDHIVLTPREKDVMACMLSFMSIKESAQYLGISPKAVEFHRTNIFAKYKVRNRNGLLKN